MLRGAKAPLLPPDHARGHHAAAPHNDKALRIIDGAGHNDNLPFAPAYFGAIRDFLSKR